MRQRRIAALAAGLGAGYFMANNMNIRREALAQQAKQLAAQNQNEQTMKSGLIAASKMKPGALQDETGPVGVSEGNFKARLMEQGIEPEYAQQAAPVYAEAAKRKGTEKWLSNSFRTEDEKGNMIDPGIGNLSRTTRGDIKRARGDALIEGGQYTAGVAQHDQAGELDVNDLMKNIDLAGSVEDLDQVYQTFPDDRSLKAEMGTDPSGQQLLYAWTEGPDGDKQYLPQGYKNFDELKGYVKSLVSTDPEAITKYHDSLRTRAAADVEMEGKQSDTRVKLQTEKSRIEAAGLEPKAKKLQMEDTRSQIADRSYQKTAKAGEEQKKGIQEAQKAKTEEMKFGTDQTKAAITQLETSLGITRDPLTQRMNAGNANMELYSQVLPIIGKEIRSGGKTPEEAARLGKILHDEANGSKVSVDAAYKAYQKRQRKGGQAAATSVGQSAVQEFFGK